MAKKRTEPKKNKGKTPAPKGGRSTPGGPKKPAKPGAAAARNKAKGRGPGRIRRRGVPIVPPPPEPNTPPPDPELLQAELRPLTEDEQRFCDEYLVDRNATRAYHATYNCDYATAATAGPHLRHRPNVAREIAGMIRAQRVRLQLNADAVLKELCRCAFSDMYQVVDPQTHLLRNPRHIPLDTRRAVSEIRMTRERTTRSQANTTTTAVTESVVTVKFWNKIDALGKLAKHLGLDTEVTPLDALLRLLPASVAAEVRAALNAPQQQQPPKALPAVPGAADVAAHPPRQP